jgi:hypothetical protein
MRKTIRLTEADLSRLIRRIIKEGNGDVLTCLATATNMSVEDLIKLAPCLELQQNPTDTTKIQACVQEVIPMAQKKLDINILDPMGSAKRIMDLAKKCLECVGNVSPVMNASINENKRRINRRY